MSTGIVVNYGMLRVSAKYLQKVRGSDNFYYVRRLPAAVVRALKASGRNAPQKVVITTGTTNRNIALKEAFTINQRLEAEWKAVVDGTPRAQDVVSAQELMQRYHNQPFDLGDFLDQRLPYDAHDKIHHIQHQSYVPYEQRQADIDDILRQQLTDAEWQAVQLARGKQVWVFSIIKEEYLRLKGLSGDRKKRNSTDVSFNTIIEAFGDVSPDSISRLDVHKLIRTQIDSGVKTATIKRKLSVVRAAINYVSRMQETELRNPFTNVEIPNLFEDAEDRKDFTPEQLQLIRHKLSERLQDGSSNQVDGLIALMLDTGMRVSEVVGLRSEDVVLDGEVPYISLHRNTLRRLKTKSSKRLIPLVGSSLEWLTQGLEASDGFIFSRYVDEAKGSIKNDTASATTNKRLKAWLEVGDGDAPTCHSFRHTMATRLRAVGCPKDVREELGGWAKTISDRYGSPTDLKLKQQYLEASLGWD